MFDWITEFVKHTGYFGVLLLMFSENLFPPIPSELIMPLAGFTAAESELNIVLAVIAGAAGSLLGSLFWYYIGLWLGGRRLQGWTARHGRWLTLTPEDVDRACAWFNRHGSKAVFFGRLIPAVRTLISVPAGFARMPLGQFLISSTLGTLLWTGFLAGAGFLLENEYSKVVDLVNPVSNVVIGVLVLWYLYRVVTFRPNGP